jgi:hypothetical protein
MANQAYALGIMLLLSGPLQGQELPKDITRAVDDFTGDTIWSTKYGRLDDPHGCGRNNLAIIWKVIRGPTGLSEAITYQYVDVTGPLSRARWLNVVRGALNVDGQIFDIEKASPLPHLDATSGDKTESGTFILPDGTLKLIAESQLAKIRLIGTDSACDGTIEQNMITRLRALLGIVG